jgi:hypothetical protein
MMIMNGNKERICKEAIMAHFKAICQHLPGRVEENHETLSQDNQCHNWVSNCVPSECKTGMLLQLPCCLIPTNQPILECLLGAQKPFLTLLERLKMKWAVNINLVVGLID